MLTSSHRRYTLIYYTVCFVACYALLSISGSLLSQTAPLLEVNKLDLSLNILMLTGLGQAVILRPWLQILIDATYLILPLLLLWSVVKESAFQYALALVNVIYNVIYVLLMVSLSAMSTPWFIASLFIPAMFIVRQQSSFYYAFHCMRYIFILAFFSAGLWKIRAGGLFNIEQMSAILLQQHGALLVADPNSGYASFIVGLIRHPSLSYILYLLGALAELVFVVGLFTKRKDRLLLAVLCLFILFNMVIMQINYFPWLTFGFLFWYSNLTEPLRQGNT